MLETLGIKNRESADSMILALVQFPGATNFVLSRDFLYKKSVTMGKIIIKRPGPGVMLTLARKERLTQRIKFNAISYF